MLFLLVYVLYISSVCLPHSAPILLKMMNNQSLSEVQQNNSNAPLSNRDIVLLLMNHCKDSIRDERDYIKDIINDKADAIVTGLTRGLYDGIARVADGMNDQRMKIAELELKIETLTSFNEQSLLHHMQNSIPRSENRRAPQNCSVCIRNPTEDLSHDHTEHYHCNSCITVFKSVKDLYFHQCTPHAKLPLKVCWKCGDTFDEEKFLVEHIVNVHTEHQVSSLGNCGEGVRTSSSCDLTLQSESVSAMHNLSAHGAPLIHSQTSSSELQCNLHDSTSISVDQVAVHGNHHHVQQYEQTSSLHQNFTNHIQNNHGHHLLSSCETCGLVFVCYENLLSHKCYDHSMCLDLHCNYCDSTFHEMRLLNIHIRDHHTVSACSPCDEVSSNYDYLESHLYREHAAIPDYVNQPDGDWDSDSNDHTESQEIIVQLDGNNTLDDMEISENDIELLPPAILIEGAISDRTPAYQGAAAALIGHQAVHGSATFINNTQVNPSNTLQYNYNLNKINQTKRLLDNSLRSPVEIRHGNYQNINGTKHPTSVTLDFNSGVYLAVIKPALEKITEGWKTEIKQTVFSCEEVSPRTDISGRKVCTKLVMYLTENNRRNKAVLHFYHTSSTLQVQGSSLMISGSPTPVWFVDNFIQPLTAKYSAENQDAISEINTNIQQSASSFCISCKLPINPTAPKPKDQELACSRCGNLFHKKCTDRWKTTAGWRRTPWYCSTCITSTPGQVQSPPRSSISEIQSPHNTQPVTMGQAIQHTPPQESLHTPTHVTVGSTQAVLFLPPTTFTTSTTRITSTPTTSCTTTSSARSMLYALSNSSETTSTSSLVTTTIFTSPSTTAIPHSAQPSFPSASTRQRSTNINTSNAELEFQRTALNACRSTVSQQEAEIKRLKETLEIRNKRIMQLEAIVGHAADTVAARDSPPAHNNISENSCKLLADRIDEISMKLEQMKASRSFPSNNIVINSCNSGSLHSRQNSFTQTEETQSESDHALQQPEHPEQAQHERGPDSSALRDEYPAQDML